jgi:hypothetical protein
MIKSWAMSAAEMGDKSCLAVTFPVAGVANS